MPLGLSARERVLPIWEVLYSSKVESWVGMLLERVIRGVVVAVGLTARRREGRGGVRAGHGDRDGKAGLGADLGSRDGARKQGLQSQSRRMGGKLKSRFTQGRLESCTQGNASW